MISNVCDGPVSRVKERESRGFPEEPRRRQILRAADEQFAACGFGGATAAAIATAAGFPEETIRLHFGTKLEALKETPEFAAEVYRAEIGASEVLWNSEIGRRQPVARLRTSAAIHLVPYSVHACMSFGLWLATLRHKPITAQAHARQHAEAVVYVARAVLSPAE